MLAEDEMKRQRLAAEEKGQMQVLCCALLCSQWFTAVSLRDMQRRNSKPHD